MGSRWTALMNKWALRRLVPVVLTASSLSLHSALGSAQTDPASSPAATSSPAARALAPATSAPTPAPSSTQGTPEPNPTPNTNQDAAAQGGATTVAPTPETTPASSPTTNAVASAAEYPASPQSDQQPRGTVDTALVDSSLKGAAEDLALSIHQLAPALLFEGRDYLAWEKRLKRPPPGKITLGALLIPLDAEWQLRLVALDDKGFHYNTNTKVDATTLEVTVVRSLSQLAKQFSPARSQPSRKAPGSIVALEDPSEGKATLAAAGALFGGYMGFAIENVGGSADAALVYPLVALGSGVGMATALIAAEEWPVSRPRAWYISGGGFWLTAAAVLIADDQDLAHATDRYPYGLIGTALGIGIASAVSSYKEVTEPQALLSNEGGAFGTLAGGLIQRLAAPNNAAMPSLGMGIGSAAGWLAAGLIGPFTLSELSSSRVLFAGLGGSVGALTGAAVASPAVVNADRREPKKEGVLFASALGGLVLGSVVGYWFGESEPDSDTSKGGPRRGASAPSKALARRLTPSLSTTPEVLGDSPYTPGLPSSTTLTLNGTW